MGEMWLFAGPTKRQSVYKREAVCISNTWEPLADVYGPLATLYGQYQGGGHKCDDNISGGQNK